MPAVKRAVSEAKSFEKRNASGRSTFAHIPAIATGPELSELRGLKFYTKMVMPDIARDASETDAVGECACATTNV